MDINVPHQDVKHIEFLKLFQPKGTQEKITLALFGIGRAGTIHLGNMLTSTRVILKYIVEERKERRDEIQKLLGPTSQIKLVGSDQTDVILKDKE